jgi:NitT/TauT family transport system ATP-binding protein
MVMALARTSVDAPGGASLSIRRVNHRFALEGAPLETLRNIDLDIEPGEFVALLGPSGCGKSTLLRLVAGLEPPSEGEIVCNGDPVHGPDPSRVVVLQEPTLYPWRKVRENVALGPEARGALRRERARIEETLSLVGLQAFANAYPHQLSGGMAQRVALARALVNDPSLLILDEPLGKLDSLTRLSMQGEIVNLWRRAGFTVLLVTHDVEEALLMSTRIIVLSDRPAAIKADIRLPQPYPRHRGDPVLVAKRQELLELLGLQSAW